MRIYTKKLLSVLTVLAILLSSMNMVLSVFAAETGVNLQLNGGTLQGSSQDYSAGDTLPNYESITKAGAVFGGWYADADFSGTQIFTVPEDASADTTYYARWIYLNTVFDDFESYESNEAFLNNWDDWHWPAEKSVTELNTDSAHANNSEKSLKVALNAANKATQLVVQKVNFPQTDDGITFWVESASGATVKIRLRNATYESKERIIPAGRHIVTIPWSEMNGAYDMDWLSPTIILVSLRDASDVAYIDDIGTYVDYSTDIIYNLNGGSWADGYTPTEAYNRDESLILPDAGSVVRDGCAFSGWYDNEALDGNAVYSIAAGTLGNKKYWAKWIYHNANFDDFESFATDADLTSKWSDWHYPAEKSVTELNTDPAHANSGEKSVKICLNAANTATQFVAQTPSFPQIGDGIALWVESENGATVKIRLKTDSATYNSQEKTVPAGKHIVTVPWSEMGDAKSAAWLSPTNIFVSAPNASDAVYIDDIGTYSERYKLTLNTNGGSWTDGYTPSEEYGIFGMTLPTMESMSNHGLAFAGWYDNEALDGNAVYSIAEGDLGDKEYWAKWVVHNADFDDFESYTSGATRWDDWHWPAENSVTELNTDPAHANSGEKSLKVTLNAANKATQLVAQTPDFPQNGKGIAFWIESENGATVKIRLRNSTYESAEKTVPGGKHIVTIPWSEMNGAYGMDWLSPTNIFVSVPNSSDSVYIDDVGTYTDIDSEGIAANWEKGFSYSYDENGKTIWSYSEAADGDSYIGFATDFILEKGKKYVIAFDYKYLTDSELDMPLKPQAVGSAFDEAEIADIDRRTLNAEKANTDWKTCKAVFGTEDENKYLGFAAKVKAGSEYDISIKNIRLYELGDVDFSGETDASDLSILKRELLGVKGAEFADVNDDGAVDIKDLIILKRMLAK